MIIICKEGTSDLFHAATAKTITEETEYSVNYTKIIKLFLKEDGTPWRKYDYTHPVFDLIKMVNEQNPYCEQFIDLDDSYGYLLHAFLKKNNIHYNFSGEFSSREIVDIVQQWDAQELAEKELCNKKVSVQKKEAPVGVESEFKA